MVTMLDHQVGWIIEGTYNTPLTVTRFGEWLAGSGLDFDANVVQGKGLRVGSQVDRAARRVALVGKGGGKVQFEVLSKGLGTLFQAIFGTGVSTLTTGATYQELFTATTAGTFLPSLTIQEGIVKPGGTVDTYTYAGCTVSDAEIEMPDSGIMTVTANIDARSLATATALATATYPSGGSLFNSGLPVVGGMQVNGTIVPATTTVLPSLTTSTAVNAKSWKLSIKNNIDDKRDVLGGRNQPVVGKRELTLTTTVEYDATTGTVFRDAYLAQSAVPILLSATTGEALSTGVAGAYLLAPAAYINKGPIPMPEDGKTVTTDIEWALLDNLTNPAVQWVIRTADIAL